jgi:uncharacterized membrane protein
MGDSQMNNEKSRGSYAFRTAVLRGTGVLLPPLATILIFVWAIGTTRVYLLEPVTAGVREGLVWCLADIREEIPGTLPGQQTGVADGRAYCRVGDGTFIPQAVYEQVHKSLGNQPAPQTAKAYYGQYVVLTYLRPYYTVPFFLAVFVLLLYLLGKFMAVGFGNFFANLIDQGIRHLPLVRSVYSGVKQVSDFLITGPEMQ